MYNSLRAALFLCVISTAVLQAQPVLQWTDFPGNPGTTILSSNTGETPVAVSPGLSGSNQIWNFASMVTTQDTQQDWLDPSSTPYGGQFPDANRCAYLTNASGDFYSYYDLTATHMWMEGTCTVTPETTMVMMANNTQPIFNFPVSYNDQWATVWTSEAVMGLMTYDSVYNVVDGWGTVVDVSGSHACLRVKSHNTIQIIYMGFPISTNTYWSYEWLSAGFGQAVSITSVLNESNPNFTSGTFTRVTEVTGVRELPGPVALPATAELEPVFPNPFNSRASLDFVIPRAGEVRLTVFDLQGREVSRLVDGVYQPGRYQAAFDGAQLPSGIYLARLQAAGLTQARKLTLLK